MALVEEAEADEFDFDADWKEVIQPDGRKPGGPDVFTSESSEATLVGYFKARKTRSALKKTLGYATADLAAPYKLYRTVPARHPRYPWMWCVGTSFDYADVCGQDQGEEQSPRYIPKVEAAEPGDNLKATAFYHTCYATLKFSNVPYTVKSDEQLESESGKEYSRFTAVFDSADPVLEILMADSENFLKFVEGPFINREFGGTLAEYLEQADLVLFWRQVPELYLTGATGYVPKRIMYHMGSVNSDVFFGFDAGTLRLGPPRMKRYRQPLWTDDEYGQDAWAYDVWLPFRYTDPRLGKDGTLLGTRRRGHRTFPAGRSGAFYAAERISPDSGGSDEYFRTTAFNEMFYHADDSTYPLPSNPLP